MLLKPTLRIILLLVVWSVALCQSQPECSVRLLPKFIPLRDNEKSIINLEDYFIGSNLTFSVQPNNTNSYIQETYQCSTVLDESLGRFLNAKLTSNLSRQYLSILGESNQQRGKYALYYFQVSGTGTLGQINIIELPRSGIQNCSDHLLRIQEDDYQVVVDCKSTELLFTKTLVTRTRQSDWQLINMPLLSPATKQYPVSTIHFSKDYFIRAVYSSFNSYIQLWSWNQQYKDIIQVIDRSEMNLQQLHIRDVQLAGNLFLILDYITGLHVYVLQPIGRLARTGSVSFEYYDCFTYDANSKMVYVSKKGMVISFKLLVSLENRVCNVIMGRTYQIHKYEPILQIVVSESALFVLGASSLNTFELGKLPRNSVDRKGNYIHYPLQYTMEMLLFGEMIFKITNYIPYFRVETCSFTSPFLYLSVPPSAQNVTVISTSIIDKRTQVCQLTFIEDKLSTNLSLIYDNGYSGSNETLFANHPGSGLIGLAKYGIGNNIVYSIVKTDTYADYTANINKQVDAVCIMSTGQPLGFNEQINMASSIGQIVVLQYWISRNVEYFQCQASNDNMACKSLALLNKKDEILIMSHEETNQGILQAMLARNSTHFTIILRVITDTVRQICTMPFVNDVGMNINKISLHGSRLYVLFTYLKVIQIYSVMADQCPILTVILNAQTLHWQYFAPQDYYHNTISGGNIRRNILYVQQHNEIVAIELPEQSEQNIVVLSINEFPEMSNRTCLIFYPYAVRIIIGENRIYQYFIDEHYHFVKLRQVPLDGKTITDRVLVAGMDWVDEQIALLIDLTHFVVRLKDSNEQHSLAVYSMDELSSVTMQYLQIKISMYDNFVLTQSNSASPIGMMQLKAGKVLSSVIDCKLTISSMSPELSLVFSSNWTVPEQNDTITLKLTTKDDSQEHYVKLIISDAGNYLTWGKTYPYRGYEIKANHSAEIDDGKWFIGSVFGFKYDCQDCASGIIKLKKKIIKTESTYLGMTEQALQVSRNGTVFLLRGNLLVDLQANRSYWPINSPPIQNYTFSRTKLLATNAVCIFATQNRPHITLSLCYRYIDSEDKHYFLSLQSSASFKGFPLAEEMLSTSGTPRIATTGNICVIYGSEVLSIYMPALIGETYKIFLLEQLNFEEQGIGSVQLMQHTANNQTTYSMFITLKDSTMQYLIFTIYLDPQQYIDDNDQIRIREVPNIHIQNIQPINIQNLLIQSHIHIPHQASIVSTNFKRENSGDEDIQRCSLMTVFDKFHSFHFIVSIVASTRVLLKMKLDGILYKYGQYVGISSRVQDYFVVKYLLVNEFAHLDEIYGMFDKDNFVINDNKVKEYHLQQVYSLNEFKQTEGRKNSVAKQEVHWQMINSTIFMMNAANLEVLQLFKKIIVEIQDIEPTQSQLLSYSNDFGQQNSEDCAVLYTQPVALIVYNPNSVKTATILIRAVDKFSLASWEIFIIVISSIAFLVMSVFFGRMAYKKIQARRKLVPLIQHTEEVVEGQQDTEDEEERRRKLVFIIEDYPAGNINLSVRESIE